jgi:filamentous hemagglutinin family protein
MVIFPKISIVTQATTVSKDLSPWFSISLCTLGYLCATNNPVFAQVTADGTVNTQVTENGSTAEITGGETRGDNLFHSFQDFSVGTGNEAFFNNADSISNIFSRVTGGNISDIDGVIRANGSANLFLINPAGIIFGENASLNIGGSFYGSSASSILFEEGEFSAADLDNPPLLTVNAPIGLGFRDNPGDIVNRIGTTKPEGFEISELVERNKEDLKQFDDSFVGLEVSPENTLALIGGNVNLDGGNLIAPGGRIEIGGLQKAGVVEFNDDGSLNFPKVIAKSNISLNNAVTLVRADGEGSITINANNLDISNSALFAGIRQGSGFLGAQAGDINLNGTDRIILDNSVIVTRLLSESIGKAGDINITANSIALNNKSSLNTETFGMGEAGNITFDVSEGISLANGSEALTEVQDIGIGNAGKINLKASSLRLTQGFSLITNTRGQGNAGNITINVPGQTTLDNGSLILTQVESGAVGNAGDININTGSLTSSNGFIIADSKDRGSGGDINLTASNTIQLAGIPKVSENLFPSGIVTGLDQQLDDSTKEFISAGQGEAGNIRVSSSQTLLTKGL